MPNITHPTAWLVVPCYNEEQALPKTAPVFLQKWKDLISQHKISENSRIVFVDDGSKDRTREIIENYHQEHSLIDGIFLSRNRGHQNAVLAGLLSSIPYCDCCISIDADLQDDIHAIDKMIDSYVNGAEVVYGVRSKRETDTWFKRFTAESFYKLMQGMGANIIFNHADYRLLSRRALEELAKFPEVNLFLRGMVPLLGYSSEVVEYERNERVAGESKYPLKKMLSFAFEGITSLSVTPIRWITRLGISIFCISLLILLYSLVRHLQGSTVIGWTSLIVSIWAIGGLILLSIGVVGEYVGKTYLETKRRPRYLIETFLHHPADEEKAGNLDETAEV